MHVVTIFLSIALTIETGAQHYDQYSVNVGTVLFSPSASRKNTWTKDDVSLLKARRHFQKLLPPPNFIDTSNNNYVNTLLNYFKKSFTTIKREASGTVSDTLMTTALSDAFGGYLKLWILPISKVSFYAGTVSQDNIIKLYQFHNELKRYMQTDGSTWRSPDKKVLESIIKNVSPPKHLPRRVKNPCNNFAYYEKHGDSMAIPTPYIDWDYNPAAMFLPLRNLSLIPLCSPEYPSALFNYYDSAKNCIDMGDIAQQNDFDDRFQSWLNSDVVPHLSDESLYLPLGSVLSLVNQSRQLCDKIIKMNDKPKSPKPIRTHYCIAGIPIDLSSKKTLVIIIILILEIAWCIPALLYLICAKRKKKKEKNNIYTLLDACRNRCHKDCDKDDEGACTYKPVASKTKTGYRGFKIGNRPRAETLEWETQFVHPESKGSMATETRSNFGSGGFSGVSVINETQPTTPLKSSLKKIKSTHNSYDQPAIIIDPVNKSSKVCSKKQERNYRTPECSMRTASYIIENDDLSTVFSPIKLIDVPVESASHHIRAKLSNTFKKTPSPDVQLPCHVCLKENLSTNLCPCVACFEAEVGSEVTVVEPEVKPNLVFSDKNIEINMEPKCPHINQAKCVKKMKNLGLKLESGRPYLEIKIDKPQTEICVGIGGTFDPMKVGKRSKIPKRMPHTIAAHVTGCTSPMVKDYVMQKKAHDKTMIPQPKKRPVDDSVIKTSKPKHKRKDSKLNVTL